MAVETPDGARLVYTGDTGPSDAMVEFAREADLLLVEAPCEPTPTTIRARPPDAEEAIDIALRARARETLLVHYPPARRAEIEAMCDASGAAIRPAVAGLVRTSARASGADRIA